MAGFPAMRSPRGFSSESFYLALRYFKLLDKHSLNLWISVELSNKGDPFCVPKARSLLQQFFDRASHLRGDWGDIRFETLDNASLAIPPGTW
jgi:hypothetical protein